MERYNLAGDGWRTCPGDAFRERTGEQERGYPGDRDRVDDARTASDSRYRYPETTRASVGAGVTALAFIRFSGQVDEVVLDPNGQPSTFTFRDDAGRAIGALDLASGPIGPLPMRCREVDVTNNGIAAAVMTVTGYYKRTGIPAGASASGAPAGAHEGAPADSVR